MRPLLAFKDEIEPYNITKDRLKWLKIIQLPFQYNLTATDGMIGKNDKAYYLLDYEKQETIFGYPKMILVDDKIKIDKEFNND